VLNRWLESTFIKTFPAPAPTSEPFAKFVMAAESPRVLGILISMERASYAPVAENATAWKPAQKVPQQ
jgi:hypothetical protein